MADPKNLSLFQQRFISGSNPILKLDEEFLQNHTKVLLRSDASDRCWKVKLDGGRLARGWEEFAAFHDFRDGDVLVFRHHGDESFNVSVSSPSNSGDVQNVSSSDVDTEDTYTDDDDDDFEEDEDDDDGDGEKDNIGNIPVNKNKKPEEDSSSGHYSFVTARVTRYSLQYDRLDLSREFNVVSFSEENKLEEIELVNEQGKRWILRLAKNSSTGVFYIRQGWKNFCFCNELSAGDICKFELVENEKRPVLWLCPHEEEEEECPEEDAMKNLSVGGCSRKRSRLCEVSKRKEKKTASSFLTLKFTPSRFKTGQLVSSRTLFQETFDCVDVIVNLNLVQYISSAFTRKNGIKNSGEITLLNKDGRKWSSYLQITGQGGSGNEFFYLRRGWREMCEANGVKVNDSFVLELIWEDANPTFKFFSKIENKGNGKQRIRKKRACETPMQPGTVGKTQRVETQGLAKKTASHRPEDEKRELTNSRSLQRTQSKSFTVSEQVANVKSGIVDTLKTVRQFRVELEKREQDMEASLLEIDALGNVPESREINLSVFSNVSNVLMMKQERRYWESAKSSTILCFKVKLKDERLLSGNFMYLESFKGDVK